jgi:ATP-dependent Clp protease ATP-binding subunit ClpC
MVGESQEPVGSTVGGGSSGSNKMPTLEEYGTNLTAQAEEGKLDPVVGRKKEIERVTQVRAAAAVAVVCGRFGGLRGFASC